MSYWLRHPTFGAAGRVGSLAEFITDSPVGVANIDTADLSGALRACEAAGGNREKCRVGRLSDSYTLTSI
jgi:hypothetical protein